MLFTVRGTDKLRPVIGFAFTFTSEKGDALNCWTAVRRCGSSFDAVYTSNSGNASTRIRKIT